MSTMDFLFAAQNGPFLVGMGVTLAIAVLELLSLVMGFGLSNIIDDLLPDSGPDLDAGGIDGGELDSTHTNVFGEALGWLNVGRVPILVLLIVFLCGFSVIGYGLQLLSSSLFGLIPAVIAGPAAAVAALPMTRNVSRVISKLVPREESYAVAPSDFVGQVATVTLGPVEAGNPGKARLSDSFGNSHFVRIRSANAGERFESGSEVLLVRRDGGLFEVIAAPDSLTD